MEDKTVIIAGGGLGSLSSAIRLGKMGFRVHLFEKNNTVGGKLNQYFKDGFRFDTGPSLLTMPFVIDELYNFAGFKRSDYLNFMPLEPLCRYFFPDGTIFNTSSDPQKMIFELERLFPNEKVSYERFLEYSARIFDNGSDVFLHTPLHEIKKLLRPRILLRLLKIHHMDPLRTMDQGIRRYLKEPHLIQIFNRYATYNGSNPFQAPATLNIIAYVENEIGGYYIRGGMYRLAEQMLHLASKVGVKIHTSARVKKIVHSGRKVSGVLVEGGFMPADYVVSGVDVVETFTQLIDGYEKEKNRLEKLEPSLSGMVFLWGISRQFPQLHHHNLVFSKDYRNEFNQIFEDLRPPDDPTIYISISSKSVPADAPAGQENWFVLLNMPYLSAGQNWPHEVDRMRHTILNKLSHSGIDVKPHIKFEKVYTPEDFYRLYGSNRGSIYGISSNSRMSAFRRSANRSRQLEGLYFAGGSVHPGGGIPLVILSGKMAAELIAEKEGIHLPEGMNLKKSIEINPSLYRNYENSYSENLQPNTEGKREIK
jgi:phytoene desaturase